MLRTLEHVLSFTTCKCSFLVPLGRLIKLPLTFVALNELHYMLPSGLRFVPLRLPFGRIVAPKGQNEGDKERRTPLKGTKGKATTLLLSPSVLFAVCSPKGGTTTTSVLFAVCSPKGGTTTTSLLFPSGDDRGQSFTLLCPLGNQRGKTEGGKAVALCCPIRGKAKLYPFGWLCFALWASLYSPPGKDVLP